MSQSSTTELLGDALGRLAEDEKHYHTIQASLRGLASTWTLAAFASVAVLLKQEKGVGWLIPPFELVIPVCLMANVGLSTVWIIDQLVYQRLFNATFIAGLQLESRYPALPPVRAILMYTLPEKISIAFWVNWFYVGQLIVFSIIAWIMTIVSFAPPQTNYIRDVTLAVLTVAPLFWVLYRARQVPIRRFVEQLPSELVELTKKERCLTIIEGHVGGLKSIQPNTRKQDERTRV